MSVHTIDCDRAVAVYELVEDDVLQNPIDVVDVEWIRLFPIPGSEMQNLSDVLRCSLVLWASLSALVNNMASSGYPM